MTQKNLLILKIVAVSIFVVSYFMPVCLHCNMDNNAGWRMALGVSSKLLKFDIDEFMFPFFLGFLPNVLGLSFVGLIFTKFRIVFLVMSVLVFMATIYWMGFALVLDKGDGIFLGTFAWMLGSGLMAFSYFKSRQPKEI